MAWFTATNQFQPDYAAPPGWILDEHLKTYGISQAEFARRCGRSPKLISEIIAGKAPLEAKTALQFEKVLGVDASIWLGIERDYRLHLIREAEAREAKASAAWARSFPVTGTGNARCDPQAVVGWRNGNGVAGLLRRGVNRCMAGPVRDG